MSKVAFLLLATPSELEATHQQTPPSCSFLFCIARKKKRDPSGRSILCELGSSGAILTGSPSLNHSIIGASGDPLARQSKVTGSFLTTVWFMGCCVITGLEAEKGISKLELSLLTNCDSKKKSIILLSQRSFSLKRFFTKSCILGKVFHASDHLTTL